MEEERTRNPADVFADALERPLAERPEFLRQACAGDPGLLAEVESLLLAHARMQAEARMAPRE